MDLNRRLELPLLADVTSGLRWQFPPLATICGYYDLYLRDADLRAADLQETDLTGADLTNAKLEGANLTGVNLRRANLRDADLRGANLTGARVVRANLALSDLREATLRGANMREANLTSADLTGAVIDDTTLTDARLNKAVITNVEMEELAASGSIKRPSDGKPAESVAFIQCAGSRDQDHLPYCSAVCCMGTLKQVRNLREQNEKATATVFYIDICTVSRQEKFYYDLTGDENVRFVKGKAAKISGDEGTGNLTSRSPVAARDMASWTRLTGVRTRRDSNGLSSRRTSTTVSVTPP